MIGKRHAKEGLYLLELQTEHGFNSKNVYSLHYDSNTVKFDTFDVCHKRLSYLSSLWVGLLPQFTSFDFNKILYHCTFYPLAKHKILPFPVNEYNSFTPFELVYCDICEPFSSPSIEDFHFF